MKLHELKPAKGAVKANRRLCRGTATGQGKTERRKKNNIYLLSFSFSLFFSEYISIFFFIIVLFYIVYWSIFR